MYASVRNVLESFRQSEYTGENRCLPCTVVNTILAVLLAVAGWLVVSWSVGLLILALSVLLIGFRGYLVPGTPELTKRYLPERVHRLFGTHHDEPGSAQDTPASTLEGEFDLERFLLESGIVEDCPDEDDLCLKPDFRTAWRDEIELIQRDEDQLERLAERLEVDVAELALEESPGGYAATYAGDRIGVWPSEAAFLADLAVVPVLDESCPEWGHLEDDQQGAVVAGLRVFLEVCPVCEGELTETTNTIESCCSTITKTTIECENCGSEIFHNR